MQSGISASKELHQAFNDLVSSPGQRGLLAGIKNEQLIPLDVITSSSADFSSDLTSLNSLIKDNEAAYIILRRYADSPDGYVAVTYVPDTAPVRQKMLFAATRLTLVRELGLERFRETLFATTKAELTAEGWKKHDLHGETKAPLTEEEQSLQDIKDAEADASRGTSARSHHVSTDSKLKLLIDDDALDALKGLKGGDHNLVQLKYNMPKETIELAGTSSAEAGTLANAVSESEPRYSFFRYSYHSEGREESPVIFIYTCPSGSKLKERMVYALGRAGIVALAGSRAGLEIARKLEASSPSEITASTIMEEFQPKQEQKSGFSRPKRPGKH
ncbi:MAG: Twinfilin-1 [Candelina mexicana]|nr:MAG: Twinfilin-1 [Candelina mexicana]